MNGEVRSELLKMRSTRTNLALVLAVLALVLLVLLIAGLAASESSFVTESDQRHLIAVGGFSTVFAALIGIMSVTGEFRHGTIRPTFLFTPRRERVLGAKLLASLLMGIVLGLVAEGLAFALGLAVIRGRGLEFAPSSRDSLLLILGTVGQAALWAALGVGAGAVLRNQVAAVVGLIVWVFVVENILLGAVPRFGRFLPGPAGLALTGDDGEELLSPAVGGLVLAGWVVAFAAAGIALSLRRDVD